MYKQQRNYENINKRLFEGIGEYQIPEIKATHYDFCEFIGFNAAKMQKDRTNFEVVGEKAKNIESIRRI